jgi:hypothetical protein
LKSRKGFFTLLPTHFFTSAQYSQNAPVEAIKSAGGNAYFDVTSGNNWYYPATPDWDFTTGLGTPNLGSFDRAVSNILA